MPTPLRLLVLENQASYADLMVHQLRRAGYEPEWQRADTEDEYLDDLGADLDLVLADSTPHLDALTALRLMKARDLDIPFVVVTDRSRERQALTCIKHGAADYVLKDHISRLGPAVAQALELKDLTNRQRQAESDLRASQEAFRDLYHHAPVAYFTVGIDGLIRRCNLHAAQVLGYAPEELVGCPVIDLYAAMPEGKEKANRVLQRVRNGAEIHGEELQMRRCDGSLLWVGLTVNVVRDDQGQVVESRSIVVDISDRKRAEAAMQRRANQLALLNDIGGRIAAVAELESVIHRAVTLVQEEFGYDHVAFFVPSDDQDRLVMVARAGPEEGSPPVGHSVPLDQGLVGWVGRQGRTLLANDVDQEPRYVNFFPAFVATRSELTVPIRSGTEVVGVVDVQSPALNAFDDSDVQVFETLASQISIAVSNARLYEEVQQELAERHRAEVALQELNVNLGQAVQQRTAELQVLLELLQQIGQQSTYDDLFQLSLEYLHRACPYDVGASLLINNNRWEITIWKTRALSQGVVIEIEMSIVRAHLGLTGVEPPREGLTVDSMNLANFDAEASGMDAVASSLQAPILIDGEPVGFLYIGSQEDNVLEYDDLRILYTVAAQAGEAIQRLRAVLAREQERLESLVENLPDGIVLLDTEKRLVLHNRAARQFLHLLQGNRPGEVVARVGTYAISDLLAHPRGAGPLVLRVAEPRLMVLELSAHTIAAQQPERRGVILYMREVTEAQSIQEQLQRQERLAAIGQLAGGIAHDFNNILTTIMLYAQMFQRREFSRERMESGLATVFREAKRASDLVRQILDFSRQSQIETQPLDLGAFTSEVIRVLQRTIPENVRLTVDIGPVEYFVNADPTRMQQVIMNLALNARDAMPHGGQIRFALSRYRLGKEEPPPVVDMPSGDWVCLAVADTGTGMSDEVQAHLFEPFFTTKPRGKGTGLGLAQVYGIIKQHDGHIRVESEVGKGTTFVLYLPAYLVARAGSAEIDLYTAELPHGKGEIILLVEDNEMVRELGHGILDALGYQVLLAEDGRQGVAAYQQAERVDLVITDVIMPEMGGVELLQALRQENPDLRALALTGYAVAEDLKQLEQEGILGIIEKPFEMEVLAEAVRDALGTDPP